MERLLLIIFLMAIVTYLPRLIPITLLTDKKLSPFVRTFLHYIPFAALGALIFPQVIYSTGNIKSSIVGCIISVVCAFFKLNVIIVVFGGIIGVWAFEMLFI